MGPRLPLSSFLPINPVFHEFIIVKVKVKGKVVPVLNLIKHYTMKAYGGVDI
jgi:hypothetical protein